MNSHLIAIATIVQEIMRQIYEYEDHLAMAMTLVFGLLGIGVIHVKCLATNLKKLNE